MASLESRDGTTSVNVSGKVNQQFSLSSAAACAGPKVAYFDFIEVGLSSSSSNGILVGFALPASNVNTAATSAESRETKKVVIEPTSIPSLRGKRVSKSSLQPPPPPAYSTISRPTSVVFSPALWIGRHSLPFAQPHSQPRPLQQELQPFQPPQLIPSDKNS
jgi:hypothetical protein